jgi:hypothetical protein
MQCRRDTAAVQQQDRLPALFLDRAELLQQGRGERIARLAAQVDDPDPGQRTTQASAELEPLELVPALGPGRRAAVDRDGILEGRPLGRDRPRVVTRIGLLLVGGIVLLVDADDADVP